MNFNDYQIQAKTTAIYPNQGKNLVYAVLGLSEEAGEVAEKMDINPKNIDKEDLVKELGDILWYVACICTEMNVNMQDIFALSEKAVAPKSLKALVYSLFITTSKISGKVKKSIRDDGGVLTDSKKEIICQLLAKTLHNVNILSQTVGAKIEEVAEANLAKLFNRKEKGTLQGSGDNR